MNRYIDSDDPILLETAFGIITSVLLDIIRSVLVVSKWSKKSYLNNDL